jgi:hypothetical protein
VSGSVGAWEACGQLRSGCKGSSPNVRLRDKLLRAPRVCGTPLPRLVADTRGVDIRRHRNHAR